MTAKQFLDGNQVKEAERSLSRHLRQRPGDLEQRTFLFELLCFSGQYDRAEKQLEVLAKNSREAEMGATFYRSILHGERLRHEAFRKQEFPPIGAFRSTGGMLNGKPFGSIRDADSEVGAHLEVYAAGAYLWIPFADIASIRIEPPRRLRDTFWASAMVLVQPRFRDMDSGEALLPVIYPFSWKSDDESVWLGKTTAWVTDDAGYEFPVGQKMFVVDGELIPLLEIRSLEFACDDAA